jgi:hypothetical protein
VSGYTKLSLRDDIENSAEKFGMGDVLEAHFARDDLEATQFGLSLQRIKPNQRVPFGHHHEQQEEVYVIVGGRWDAIRIAPEVTRGVEAGPDGLDIVAFGAPNTGLHDAKQQMGWWAETD